jgi:small subunit ribosomal protein S16
VTFDVERAKHWLKMGATPSERVQHFFSKAGLCEAPKRHEQTKQHMPKAKAQERAKAQADAAAKAAEAQA